MVLIETHWHKCSTIIRVLFVNLKMKIAYRKRSIIQMWKARVKSMHWTIYILKFDLNVFAKRKYMLECCWQHPIILLYLYSHTYTFLFIFTIPLTFSFYPIINTKEHTISLTHLEKTMHNICEVRGSNPGHHQKKEHAIKLKYIKITKVDKIWLLQKKTWILYYKLWN